MTDVPDDRLLEQFARNGSEEAFAALVQRHIALVHSVALRHTANAQHAQDITQAVFVILARKAGTLGRRTVLPGWLYHTARLTAANLQRAETSRVRREQEAFMQSQLEEPAINDALWRELSPQLDEAMTDLGTSERDALVLRYFQNKSMAEVGKFLGLAENTAQKRVSRALEKLRNFFAKRGVSSTTAILAGAISANSVQAVPVTLAKSVTAVALAKGATASTSTLTLIKGALKIMAWTKAKTVIVGSVVALLAVGTTTVTVKEIHDYWKYSWEVAHPNNQVLEQAPPQVTILPAKFLESGGGGWAAQDGRVLGISAGIVDMLQAAYATKARMVFTTELPQDRYDFIANLPTGTAQALQTEIKRRFGLVGRLETIETNVLVLTVKFSNAQGLKPNRTRGRNNNPQFGEYSCVNQPISGLTYFLELYLGTPIIDRTGLKGGFDMDVKWDDTDKANRNVDGLKQALIDQLGLELVPGREPVEMLVVEKAR